jgi:septum formation protein
LIALDAEVLGKPMTREDASRMLQRLSGREHRIYTAVAVCGRTGSAPQIAVEPVRVWVRSLSNEEIEGYVRTGESMGKAGAYAMQGLGGHLIERMEGDYTAAVGLPLRLVATLLQAAGIPIPVSVDQLYQTKPYPNWTKFSERAQDDATA